MKQAFLSYARGDIQRAKRLYSDLSHRGLVRVWFDNVELVPGMEWEPAIRKAIRESDYFLALLSRKAVTNRGFRHTELREALAIVKEFRAGSIFLIPVRLNDCTMPRAQMKKYHFADLFPRWADGVADICRAFEVSGAVGGGGARTVRKRKRAVSGKEKSTTSKTRRLLKAQAPAQVRYDISLVALDRDVPTIGRITRGLNKAQSHFHFTNQRMPTPPRAVTKIDDNPQLYIPRLPKSFYTQLGLIDTDYVICLSKRLLAVEEKGYVYYNYLGDQSAFDPRVFFISYSALNDYAREAGVSMDSAIAYLIVGELVDFFLKLGYHKETRNCPMDFVDDHSKLAGGLRAGRFCRFCSKTLKKNRAFAAAFRAMIAWDR
jgi:hypothetical protein